MDEKVDDLNTDTHKCYKQHAHYVEDDSFGESVVSKSHRRNNSRLATPSCYFFSSLTDAACGVLPPEFSVPQPKNQKELHKIVILVDMITE